MILLLLANLGAFLLVELTYLKTAYLDRNYGVGSDSVAIVNIYVVSSSPTSFLISMMNNQCINPFESGFFLYASVKSNHKFKDSPDTQYFSLLHTFTYHKITSLELQWNQFTQGNSNQRVCWQEYIFLWELGGRADYWGQRLTDSDKRFMLTAKFIKIFKADF